MIETIIRKPADTTKLPPQKVFNLHTMTRGMVKEGKSGMMKSLVSNGYKPPPDYWPRNVVYDD